MERTQMPITTTTITGPVLDATGQAYTNAVLQFKPVGVIGDDAADAVIAQSIVEVTPDASTGAFSVDLVVSDLVAYTVQLIQSTASSRMAYVIGKIFVPDTGTAALQDLLPLYDPGTPTNAELLAALSAAVAAAELAAESAQVTHVYLAAEDWATLLTLIGPEDGAGAEVQSADAGTHSDATATGYDGAIVANSGRYRWNSAWGRWVRIGEASVSINHTHSLADVTGLTDALDGIDAIAPMGKYEISRTCSISGDGNAQYASSIFSGWGGQVGALQNFSRVYAALHPFDAADLPANIRLRVYDGSRTGTLLGDSGEVSLPTLTLNARNEVPVDLPALVENLGAANLWIEWVTDGKTGTYGTTPAVEHTGAPKSSYSTSQNLSSPNSVELGTSFDIWFCVAETEEQALPTDNFVARMADGLGVAEVDTSDLETKIAESIAPAVTINLPSTIYAVQGVEINIYLGEVVDAQDIPGGVAALRFDIRDRTSAYIAPVGKQYGERWAWTPTGAATADLALDVHYRGALITSQDFDVIAVASAAGAANSRQVLVIGDSTNTISAGAGVICAELERYGASTGPTITTIGNKTGVGTDFDSVSRTVNNEATGGYTARRYWEETGGASPFFSGGVFDFDQYLTDNSITLTAGDWVIFDLGPNDILSGIGPADVAARVDDYVTAIDGMIAAMKTDAPGLNYGITTILPSAGDPFRPAEKQSAFGGPYSAAQSYQDYEYSRSVLLARQILEYGDRAVDAIYLICSHGTMDPESGFSASDVAANAYTSDTVARYGDAIHPRNVGHFMRAAAIWAAIKSLE